MTKKYLCEERLFLMGLKYWKFWYTAVACPKAIVLHAINLVETQFLVVSKAVKNCQTVKKVVKMHVISK